MFGLFKKKTNDADSIEKCIKTVYEGMNDQYAPKMFYGGADKACDVLIPMGRIISGTDALTREQLELTAFVYSQLWIRCHGGFDQSFSEEAYIRDRMRERFDQINPVKLNNALDVGFAFIRSHEYVDPAVRLDESEDETERELIDALIQTSNPPIGVAGDAWKWATEKYILLKGKNANADGLVALAVNMIKNLTGEYSKHYREFMSMTKCEEAVSFAFIDAIENKRYEDAKRIADPYLDDILENRSKFSGKYCFADDDEARVFRLANPQYGEINNTEMGITPLIILYCKVLNNILHSEEEPDDKEFMQSKTIRKRELLTFTSEISPCNAEVWYLLAQCYDNDEEEKWSEAVRNALYVCTDKGLLGSIYADMAIHYSLSEDKDLAKALYTVSKRYSDNLAATFLLSKMNLQELENGNADAILEERGIQNGFSDLV